MTILTKNPEKAPEKVELPLVGADAANQIPSAPLGSVNGGDFDTESMIHYRRRMSVPATIFLFFAAFGVMLMGILCGMTIYRLYGPSNQMHFRGMCDIPYDKQALAIQQDMASAELRNHLLPQFDLNFTLPLMKFFREDYELDLSDNESYSKINVPDFLDGRRGRFMHDFKENQSVIIDDKAYRCFVMPLDRENVLPPKSFYDLMEKIKKGYYEINTERIRQNWRVVTPEITDMSLISSKVANECIAMKIYLLEKYVSSVFKRSAELDESGKYAEFAGKHIIEMNLINIHQINELEKNST